MGTNRNLAVGLFVTAAIAIGVVFTVWITGKKGNAPTATYSILIQNDVSGLSIGGPVYFLGVAVGEVTNMTIVSGDPPAIRVDIEVLASTPVDGGSRATLAAQGITGVSVINLSNQHGVHPRLEVTPGYEHPLIPFRDSGFAAILSTAPKILEKIEQTLDRANQLLDEKNQASVRAALANMERLSEALAHSETGVGQVANDLRATLGDVRLAIGDLRQLVQVAGPGVQTSIVNIERATSQLADVTGRLDGWLSTHETEVRQFVGDGLGQVPGLIRDSRNTLRELDKLLEQLRRDPSVLIYKPERNAVPVEE
jgi:phospholipid/cholesterol/gamma-HCH transport system substrate-binding protein